MTDQEQKIESLARIEQMILWVRNDIREQFFKILIELEKHRSKVNFPMAYFIGGLFTIGIFIEKLTSAWMYLYTFICWPVFLGGWVNDTVNKFLDLLK